MDVSSLWCDVRKQIGFYTKENAAFVPQAPGVYGWFLPLWIYTEDLSHQVEAIRSVFDYDHVAKGKPCSSATARFAWSETELTLVQNPKLTGMATINSRWTEMLSDNEARSAFEPSLMIATLLMPPLYIGKADDLSVRYQAHATGQSKRFVEYIQTIKEPLSGLLVSDLLFVCIEMPADQAGVVREKGLNELLEQLIMRFARPPFSVR